jgi:glucose/arabinose dehydrogenase
MKSVHSSHVPAPCGKSPRPGGCRSVTRLLLLALLVVAPLGLPVSTPAATIWTGPTITFTKADGADPTQAANQDRMTPNVWITRGNSQGIYNAKSETLYTHNVSPADTEWATGTTANYASLTYRPWELWYGGSLGGGPAATLNTNAVLHLISEDIYLDIKLTSWSGGFGSSGGFSYVRSTPSGPNVPPSVAITNPINGGTFTAGTPLTIAVHASDSDGSVTNVEFFDGATSLGSDATGPDFSLTTTLYTGEHLLTAVATDNLGESTVSATVTNTGVTVPILDPIAERVPKGDITIELQSAANGMAAPLGVVVPDDGSGRMFVHDQDGRVWIVTSAGRMATPLLDVRGRLVLLGAYDERGLLGLATHPNFAANPLIYTYTSEPYNGTADFQNGLGTTNNHQSVIAEWRISTGNSNLVDIASRREILRIDQPQSNHNGGSMHFGPDGKLYIVLGDGGQANDVAPGHVAGGNAQDINRIWGKLLRLDVDGSNSANGQYGVPLDNPFVGTDGLDEIWAYGLRNPFSFNFERGTTNLYLADVGQNKVEEVDIITKGGNYGWNVREASFWFDGAGNVVTAPVRPVPPDLIDPIAQYDHDDGLAVICGFVYHGTAIPELQGRFVFGDWGSFGAPSGRLFYLDAANKVKELRLGVEDRIFGMWIRGFGQDANGELYVLGSRQLGPTGDTGRMLKLVPVPRTLMMTSIAPSAGTNIVTTWTGGNGPFALQKKSSLEDAAWQNTGFSSTDTASAAADTTAGFFRAFDVASQYRVPLTAYLSGPSSPGFGTAIFALEGNVLSFNIRYSGLSSLANNAHIHGPASSSQSAGVLIPLVPSHVGPLSTNGVFTGTLTITDEQRALILAGKTYVNIHTVNFGGGEIRGQIAPVAMQVQLSSSSNPAASGFGTLTLVHTQLTVNVTYRGLSGAATMSHIHGPAPVGGSAGVLVGLDSIGVPYGSSGSLSGTVGLTPTQLGYLIDGLTYINFHTTANPGGELRGQILPQATAVPFTTLMNGDAVRPPVTTTGNGAGTLLLEGNLLSFNINYSGLSDVAINSHIHGPTNTTQSAGVLVPLGPFNGGAYGTAGSFSGSVELTTTQRDALLRGLTYVNIHTPANPGGEIRGQIAPVLMWSSLSGVNERNTATDTPATGAGTFALVRNQLTMNLTYRDLLSPATASHIHGPASLFQSAGVLVGLDSLNGGGYGSFGGLSGTVPLATSNLLSVIDGSTYINFHTTNYPSGEIRGQIMR